MIAAALEAAGLFFDIRMQPSTKGSTSTLGSYHSDIRRTFLDIFDIRRASFLTLGGFFSDISER